MYFTGRGLGANTATRDLTLDIANALFEAVRTGIKIEINQNYALRDVIDAHRALEARMTTGSTVFSV